MATFIASQQAIYEEITARFSRPEPVFLSRIGGSDTAAVVDFLQCKDAGSEALFAHFNRYVPVVSRYNGFYDIANSRVTYLKYIQLLLNIYLKTDLATLCNYQLLSLFFKESLHPTFYKEEFENKVGYQALMTKIAEAQEGSRFYPYQFIERLVFENDTLFRAFTKMLHGRNVLVISPFSESIAANFHNRHQFFRRNYRYPEFQVDFVTTPITYAGLPLTMYPHENWFDTLAAIQQETEGKQFDIALLACGSYAMPLGEHIKASGGKAIYVGGVLQLFFGVMGRRYNNSFFLDQINSDKYIYPVERERYLQHMDIHEGQAKEAFGAYF